MSHPTRLLIVEDDRVLAESLRTVLAAEGYEVMVTHRGDEGCAMAASAEFDAVLTDLRIQGMGGLELIEKLHMAKPKLPILLMTAHGSTETAIRAMKLGAYDYLLKPFDMAELLELLAKVVSLGRQMREVVELGGCPTTKDALVGNSRAMQMIYKEIGKVAAQPLSVLIRGETGTGKELIARAIYQHSARDKGPFIAVNCAAIPETLLESELFGHERGAFTGAVEKRIGRFEQASGGTLFLDEIGEMGPSTQAKLLRVLQERVIQRLGGKELIPVDVRIIAATHVNLESAISEKLFREDLLYRLNQVLIMLPPLRDRLEDVPLLVNYFLRKHGEAMGFRSPSIVPDALECLRGHPWPGNVRELENVVRRALLEARGYPVNQDHIRKALASALAVSQVGEAPTRQRVADLLAAAEAGELEDAYRRFIAECERELFTQAMSRAQGNQTKAAKWLGISRVTMLDKLRQHGLRSST